MWNIYTYFNISKYFKCHQLHDNTLTRVKKILINIIILHFTILTHARKSTYIFNWYQITNTKKWMQKHTGRYWIRLSQLKICLKLLIEYTKFAWGQVSTSNCTDIVPQTWWSIFLKFCYRHLLIAGIWKQGNYIYIIFILISDFFLPLKLQTVDCCMQGNRQTLARIPHAIQSCHWKWSYAKRKMFK